MKKFENFIQAFDNLKDIYNYESPYGNVELTGLVGLFEVCFEQAWKAMKEILQQHGYAEAQTGSPKMVLKTAYQAGMISNESVWLDALVSCNNVAHSYNKAIAMDIVHATKDKYYDIFQELIKELEMNWM
ncbi:MAG: HI0074 family nucleotidyltransferase substrate-binding subunit [Lachnospiraceae bacterium]